MYRRKLLLGVGSLVAVSGCTDDGVDDGGGGSDDSSDDDAEPGGGAYSTDRDGSGRAGGHRG